MEDVDTQLLSNETCNRSSPNVKQSGEPRERKSTILEINNPGLIVNLEEDQLTDSDESMLCGSKEKRRESFKLVEEHNRLVCKRWLFILYTLILFGASMTFYHSCCISYTKPYFWFKYRQKLKKSGGAMEGSLPFSGNGSASYTNGTLVLEFIEFSLPRDAVHPTPQDVGGKGGRGEMLAYFLNLQSGKSLPAGLQARARWSWEEIPLEPVDFCICLRACSVEEVRRCHQRGGIAVWETTGTGRRGSSQVINQHSVFRDKAQAYRVDGYVVPNQWQQSQLSEVDPYRPSAVIPMPHMNFQKHISPADRAVSTIGFIKLGQRWGGPTNSAVKAPSQHSQQAFQYLATQFGLKYKAVVLGEGVDSAIDPGEWGEGLYTSKSLSEVDLAFIWPNEPGNYREVSTESTLALAFWWSYGVPVIYYPYPSFEDLDRDKNGTSYPGLLHTLDDAEDMIERIIEDPKFRTKMIAIGLERAQRLSLLTTIQLYPFFLCKLYYRTRMKASSVSFCNHLSTTLIDIDYHSFFKREGRTRYVHLNI